MAPSRRLNLFRLRPDEWSVSRETQISEPNQTGENHDPQVHPRSRRPRLARRRCDPDHRVGALLRLRLLQQLRLRLLLRAEVPHLLLQQLLISAGVFAEETRPQQRPGLSIFYFMQIARFRQPDPGGQAVRSIFRSLDPCVEQFPEKWTPVFR